MSFEFPKPKSKTTSSSSYDQDFHLLTNPEPDYDELLVRLSLFAFNQLSPKYQQQKIQEISHLVNAEKDVKIPEESDVATKVATFEALFKKLPYADQLEVFLSKFLKSIKRANNVPTSSNNKLKRSINRSSSSLSSSSSSIQDVFNGFSTIWFEGQSALGQEMLLKQLEKGTKGIAAIQKRRDEESEEDFKLRRFKKLSMSCVVDFRVQLKFLKNAERKLQNWGEDRDRRLIVEPQDFDTASQFLASLWSFGVSLMSAEYQEEKIDEMTAELQQSLLSLLQPAAEDHSESEEATRIQRSTHLFNQVPVSSRIDLFKELRTTLKRQKHNDKAVHVFKRLCSKTQTEIIDYMLDLVKMSYWDEMEDDTVEDITEKISSENEEDFRFRRFMKLRSTHVSIWETITWPEPYSMLLETGDDDPYDMFMCGVTTIWFKATCADMQRNPIQLILLGKLEIGDTIPKLAEESEEDYRLRRFRKSFKQLDFSSKNCIMDYIEDTLSRKLGIYNGAIAARRIRLAKEKSEGKGLFDSDWISYRAINPRDLVAVSTNEATTNQAASIEAAILGEASV